MSLRSDLGRLRALDRVDRRLLVHAVAWLAIVRVFVTTLSFRRMTRLLGLAEVPGDSPAAASTAAASESERPIAGVGWAVRTAARHTPWRSTCLVQSLAAHEMLRRRGVASSVYLGVAKNPTGGLAAHSWLRAGATILTGDHGHDSFQTIAVLVPSGGACPPA